MESWQEHDENIPGDGIYEPVACNFTENIPGTLTSESPPRWLVKCKEMWIGIYGEVWSLNNSSSYKHLNCKL